MFCKSVGTLRNEHAQSLWKGNTKLGHVKQYLQVRSMWGYFFKVALALDSGLDYRQAAATLVHT
jgi:hypothetical protein